MLSWLLHVELGERPGRLAAVHNAVVSIALAVHALEEGVVPIARMALGDGVEQAPDRPAARRRILLDALDSYLENRQSRLGAMKSVVVADPKAPPPARSLSLDHNP